MSKYTGAEIAEIAGFKIGSGLAIILALWIAKEIAVFLFGN